MSDKQGAGKSAEEVFKPRLSISRTPPPSRPSSVQSVVSEQSSKRRREEEPEGESMDVDEGYLSDLRKIRQSLETVIFSETSKVSKGVLRSVLDHFARMETVALTLVEKVSRLEGRLHERDDLAHVAARLGPSPLATPVGVRVRSFADALKKPKKNNKIIVKPKEVETVKDSDEVKHEVITQLGSDADGIRVRNFRKLKDKQVLIETQSEKDMEILRGKVSAVDKFECRSPGTVLPRLIIYDVDAKLSEEQVVNKLIQKNLDFLEDAAAKLKIVQKTGPRGGDRVHYIVQATGQVRDVLLSNGRVFIDWNSHRVRDWNTVSRCYRCQGFGHVAAKCTRDIVCGYCAEKGHRIGECKKTADNPVCANCKLRKRTDNHKVTSQECPEFKRATEALITRIDFN